MLVLVIVLVLVLVQVLPLVPFLVRLVFKPRGHEA
jgi:hypothetical protein